MRTWHVVASIVVVAGGGSSAVAALIEFDNSALQFRLEAWSPPVPGGNSLDLTHGPSEQAGGAGLPIGTRWLRVMTFTSTDVAPDDLLGNASASIAAGTEEFTVFGGPSGNDPFTFLGARRYLPGDFVGADADFSGVGASIGAHGNGAGQHWFLGDEAFVGVRMSMGSDFHYGWIHLELVPRAGGGTEYQPTAWAFESTPNTPAAVPAPGAAVLGLGALRFVRRRRSR